MSNELYSNYLQRRPRAQSLELLKRWHSHLFEMALGKKPDELRILEVGPGLGLFAEVCRERGHDYRFVDTSSAIHRELTDRGFEGYLCALEDLNQEQSRFDVVWMSHVLEHSPSWLDARQMLASAFERLSHEGVVVVVSPDLLSLKREFWNSDATHGYPTTLKNVAQLLLDVGFGTVDAWHHRFGSRKTIWKMIAWVLCLTPHSVFDRILSNERYRLRDGLVYSWKTVFGWRQIMVIGRRGH